ncbi:MAG: peptidoglycan DD-metalloendopeptidase family protein [Actinomycetota bacterium]|nr:peptidoglycan DD-metalloendopeptidase family protein [Actinomycetota bacterium]
MIVRVPFRMLALASTLFAVALFAALSSSGDASAESLQSKISKKRSQVKAKKQREQVLSSDVAKWSRKINVLQGDITTLQRRQFRLEADLSAKRTELTSIQARLRAERLRLVRLRARLAKGREALAVRLVELYKADKPDYVSVMLEADGYADLLERTEFMKRVSDQDRRIITYVVAAKEDAKRTAERLDKLEERQRYVTEVVEQRRDEVTAIKGKLVQRRGTYEAARSDKAQLLASTREDRHDLEGDLSELEAASARVTAQLASAASAPAPAGPVKPGSSGLIWPVNGPIVSPFGPRWGRLHAGVDIAVPSGTPLRAAASGRVVLLGWTGGYGNYTCIAHSGALSTCYAHQSRYATSMGATVEQGQVIGYVGCTGRCFGDHVHFETRISGSPVNPGGYL